MLEDEIDDGVEIGDADLTVAVDIGGRTIVTATTAATTAATAVDDDHDHTIGIGNRNLTITIHIPWIIQYYITKD